MTKNARFFDKLFILVIVLLTYLGRSETCFDKGKFPKFYAPANGGYKTQTYSITYSEPINAVFSGGLTEETATEQAWFMRVDLDTNQVRWRRQLTTMQKRMVTAMAVNPAGTKIAVVTMSAVDRISISEQLYLFVARTIDGGYDTERITYTIGKPNEAAHYVRDNGLVFASNGIVYMALMSNPGQFRDASDGSFNNYAGRQMVAAFNPGALSLDWIHEQPEFFGYSVTLVYRQYCVGCGNLFVGGSNDATGISIGDPKRWVIAITRLTEDGQSPPNSVFHINQEKWNQD